MQRKGNRLINEVLITPNTLADMTQYYDADNSGSS